LHLIGAGRKDVDLTIVLGVLVGADQSALEQGGKDFAWAT